MYHIHLKNKYATNNKNNRNDCLSYFLHKNLILLLKTIFFPKQTYINQTTPIYISVTRHLFL